MSVRSLTVSLLAAPGGAKTRAAEQVPAETLALRGDAEAWNVLVRRHSHRVALALLARGVRADVARDVIQEAWMRLVEQQRRGRLSHLRLPALVIRQALFVAQDRARRGDQRFEHVTLQEERDGADVEAHLIARDRLARARAVLSRCSPSEQHVFRAIYACPGAPSAEIAADTGLSVQRVRQIVCEVRKKLRASMEVIDDE